MAAVLALLLLPAAHAVVQLDNVVASPFFLSSESLESEPMFAEPEANLTAPLGGTVFLHCPVLSTGDRAVTYPSISWVRLRDWHILSSGSQTYTSDSRFAVLHKEGAMDWVLQIRRLALRDQGIYECQVSTQTGIVSRRIHLHVVEAVAFILGGDEYHIDRGSHINLVCVIENAPAAPQYVFWYRDNRMVNYDEHVRVRSSSKGNGDHIRTESVLRINDAEPGDSGNYSCHPSNADTASIQVFVAKGKDKMEALHKVGSEARSEQEPEQKLDAEQVFNKANLLDSFLWLLSVVCFGVL